MTQPTIAGDRIPPRPSSTVVNVTEDIQLRIDHAADPHNDSVTLEYLGVQVTITKREAAYAARHATSPETRLILVDQEKDSPAVALYLNDDPVIDTSR